MEPKALGVDFYPPKVPPLEARERERERERERSGDPVEQKASGDRVSALGPRGNPRRSLRDHA